MNANEFQHVNYFWDDAHARTLGPLDRLVYRSNCLGADQRVTNTGGGNTSSKITQPDPLTGKDVNVMWVKGSGGDLRTSKRENFASLYTQGLNDLKGLYQAKDQTGPKTPAEDEMVAMYKHVTFNLNPRASSIDTPLHGFLSHKHIDHMHPNAVIAIAACKDQIDLTQRIYGDELAYIPWQRPGFDLGLRMEEIAAEHPEAHGIMMGQHGLINWADDDKACYELTLSLIEKAARFIADHDQGERTFGGAKYTTADQATRRQTIASVLPWLRGQVSQTNRLIATVEDRASILEFVNSHEAPRLAEMGTSCPDHFLRTKIKPLYVDWDPAQEDADALKRKLGFGLEKYRADYRDYYQQHKYPDSPPMRDPNPTVILIPGLGMVSFGKNKSESRVAGEFYNCAVQVMRGAEAVSEYQGIGLQEAFDIEYWALEEAKLRRQPPEKELARQVVAVIGAGSGIGREVSHRLQREGASVLCVDLNRDRAEQTADQIEHTAGKGIGVAGSGVSGCGDVLGLGCDVTSRDSIRQMLDQATLAFGGLDALCVTAGTFPSPDSSGKIADEKWQTTFEINVTGMYLVADEAAKTMQAQNLPGQIALTTSVNGVVPKKGSLAYDTSKAAANHLVRELAVELAPLIRVNGVAPATVVQGSSMFPRDRVIASLTKYDVPFNPNETDDSLREKLAAFYAQRTLTHVPITPTDQAEALFLLLSHRLDKTTGQILTVDGGLPEAFLR